MQCPTVSVWFSNDKPKVLLMASGHNIWIGDLGNFVSILQIVKYVELLQSYCVA